MSVHIGDNVWQELIVNNNSCPFQCHYCLIIITIRYLGPQRLSHIEL